VLVIPPSGTAALGLRTLVACSGAVLVPGWVAGPVAIADLAAPAPLVIARADQLAPVTDAATIDGEAVPATAGAPVVLALGPEAEAALLAAVPAEGTVAPAAPAAAAPGDTPDVMLVQGSGAVVELPATAVAPGGAPMTGAAGRTAGEAAQTPAGSGFRFRLAPIRWVGNVAEIINWSKDHTGASTLQNVLATSIAGNSYVWQPWLAQVAAGIGLVYGSSTTSSGDEQGGGGRDTGFGVTGFGTLALFPVSRFPFNAAFELTDSRTSGVATTSDFKSMRLSLRQDYAPLRSPWTFSAGYDRSVVDASNQPDNDTADAFRASVARNWATQQLNGNVQYSSNRTATGSEFSFGTASLRHGWQPAPNLTLDSYAAYSRSEQQVAAAAQPALLLNSYVSTVDVSTFAGWQPDTERPLSVGANLRYSRIEFAGGTSGGASHSVSAGLNAGYSVTPHLSVYGSGQVSTSDSRDTLGIFAAGLSYTPASMQLAGFTYSWSGNANASYQTGASEGASNLITTALAHNVFRQLYSGERSTLSMSAGQGVTLIQSSGEGSTVTLGNSIGATWTVQQSENLLTTFSGTFADTRATGSQEYSSQQLSLQANGNMQFSRYAGAAANLTIQGTRQDNGLGVAPGATQWNTYGTLSYQHGRAFGIPRLRYTALYTGNTLQLNGRQQGNLNALPDQVTHSLEQRMFYRVGRLDLEGLLRFAEIDGKRNSYIFIRINRQFGAF
jgi:hypothetical protein